MACFIEQSREFHLRKTTENDSEIIPSQLVGSDTNFSLQCCLNHSAEYCCEWRRSTWASWALSAITALPNYRNMKNQNAHSSYQPPAFLLFVDRDQRKLNLLIRAGVRMNNSTKWRKGLSPSESLLLLERPGRGSQAVTEAAKTLWNQRKAHLASA